MPVTLQVLHFPPIATAFHFLRVFSQTHIQTILLLALHTMCFKCHTACRTMPKAFYSPPISKYSFKTLCLNIFELKCCHLPVPINTLTKHKIERAGGLAAVGFGGTALTLLSPLVIEAELYQQITASFFKTKKSIFFLKISLARQ